MEPLAPVTARVRVMGVEAGISVYYPPLGWLAGGSGRLARCAELNAKDAKGERNGSRGNVAGSGSQGEGYEGGAGGGFGLEVQEVCVYGAAGYFGLGGVDEAELANGEA